MNARDIEIRRSATRVRLRALRRLAFVLLLGAAPACDDSGSIERSNVRGGGSEASAAPAASAATESAKKKEREPLVFRDETFVESIRNRDPFRTYSTTFKSHGTDAIVQRHVLMPAVSVEEMRLIAIVTGMPRPKAMLVAPDGIGYVVERGDYVGRPKVIQATGSVSMTLNWRVDRIRENEVVLTQQDPADPNRAALTKIIPLRDEVAVR